jgi:integrase
MPKGSQDGSVYKRQEKRVTYKGKKRTEVEIWQWYSRVRYIGLDGLEHEKKRRANPNNYAQACELKRKITKEIEEELNKPTEETVEHTFSELSKHYKEEYLIPPLYVGGVKVAGLRSHKKQQTFFNPLVKHFSDTPLKEITYEVIRKYKNKRLATPVVIKRKDRKTKREWADTRQRSLAAVHRELELLRRMLSIARHKRWINENPFEMGDPLINKDDEVQRMRILTHEEERKLLEACGARTLTVTWRGRKVTMHDTGKRRAYLRSVIILSIDTAARHGEEFQLRRCDVYLEDKIIIIQSWISKTGKERIVPMTDRLHAELVKLLEVAGSEPEALLIPRKGVKKAFRNACLAAGITDYRWHDNRHTGTMRMLDAIRDQTKVMKITGHTNLKTFLRYVNLNREIAQEAGRLMNERRAELEKRPAPSVPLKE